MPMIEPADRFGRPMPQGRFGRPWMRIAATQTAPTVAAVGTLVEAIGNVSPAWPAGHAANDIGLLIVESANDAIATPAGWTALQFTTNGTSGAAGSGRISYFWARATSGAEAAPTVTGAIDHASALIIAIRGCPSAIDPILGQSIGTSAPLNANPVTMEEVYVKLPNALLVAVAGRTNASAAASFSNWINGNLTGFAEIFDGGTTLGHGGGFAVAAGVLAGVSSSSGATTTDTSIALPSAMHRSVIAFRPS